jgi:hypothetical protein
LLLYKFTLVVFRLLQLRGLLEIFCHFGVKKEPEWQIIFRRPRIRSINFKLIFSEDDLRDKRVIGILEPGINSPLDMKDMQKTFMQPNRHIQAMVHLFIDS